MKRMSLITILLFFIVFLTIAGCSTIIGKTNMLTNGRIKSATSGVLGYSPNDITIVSRRTEGVNTYINLKTNDGKEFTCIINGGNLLTLGMINPPMCSKKGEPINANPFRR